MEQRQNHVLVGAVTLVLLALLIGFVLWLSGYSGEKKREFDIFFRQSVSGLTVGSAVSFSGVPVGQVRQVRIVAERPEFVRVRIEVADEVPVLEGTTASLQGVGFTGVTQIQLAGSQAGQPPLTTPGPNGVPVIPSTASGFSQLLESAPQTLERVNILLARLNEVFDDQNRASLSAILQNLDTTTAALAAETPALRAAIRETQHTMRAATAAAQQISTTGASADTLIHSEITPLVQDLRATVTTADKVLAQMGQVAAHAGPGMEQVTQRTVPEVNRLISELRELTQNLGALSARMDEDPLGTLTGSRPLPDYQPEKAR